MEQYNLDKVHQTDLKILKEIDRICRKYHIRYMLDAGTLLGAVRHGGFVPWDDDADIVFTRSQYEAFLKVAEEELPEGMRILHPEELRGGKAFYDFTARVSYDNSRIHKEDDPDVVFYEGKLNHLFVDMFVLDKLPEKHWQAQWTLFLHKAVYGMAMGHRRTLDFGKYSPFHKLAVGSLSMIGKLIPMKWLFAMQHAVAVKDRKKKSNLYYYSNYQPDYLHVTLQKKWCDEITDIRFCDTELMATKYADEVLRMIYGDYWKLPPSQEQRPSHSSIQIQIFDEEQQDG